MENKLTPLSGNTLKSIAAISMTLDHIGVMLFPHLPIFKALGRLAFPIFAFFIAEGCRYTRNKARYLLTIMGMAVVFQAVYFFVLQDAYMSVFVTFSLGIILIYLLDAFKRSILDKHSTLFEQIALGATFLLALVGVYLLNQLLTIDYRFYGCILPLFASLFHIPKETEAPEIWKKLDTKLTSVVMMSIPMLFLIAAARNVTQAVCLLTVPLLMLYSGKRGKYNMKYFFYIFYPAHMVIIFGISLLMAIL